jgi:hypothetical protein
MKKFLTYSLFTILFLTLYGCPVALDYAMVEPGSEKIVKELIGTWTANAEDPEAKKLVISKKDDTSYKVEVLEKGTMYMPETTILTGWIAKIDDKTFFFVQAENTSTYYHYMIKELKDNNLVTCSVSLLDGGIDTVKSTESLYNQIKTSMGMADFCSETISWTKE